MVSTLKVCVCLISVTTTVQVTMVREIVKVSFLLILLIQFQTGSYNFLHATDTSSITTTADGVAIHEKSPSQVSSMTELSKQHRKIKDFLHLNNATTSTVVKNKNNKKQRDENDEPLFYNVESTEISAKMNPQELFMFEQKLLKLLGMKKRPERDRERSLKVPKYLRQLYNYQLQDDFPTSNLNLPGRFVRTANIIRSFYHTGNEIQLEGFHFHMNFDITSIPENEEITGAELRVPFILSGKLSQLTVQVLVHDIVQIQPKKPVSHSTAYLAQAISYPMDTKMLKLSNGDNIWLTFDVFPAVNRWNLLHAKKNKLAIAIELVVLKGNVVLTKPKIHNYIRVRRSSKSLYQNQTSLPPHEDQAVPMLLTYSDDGHNPKTSSSTKTLSRRYRSHINQKRRKHHRIKHRKRNICSKKKMFVDFTDVGWNDWIVAPPGYHAYYCSGECPFPMAEHLNATNHAVIQALVNSMDPRLVPPPCCVPKTYSSLSLLYTDSSDRIVLKNYKEMIVESCGCS